MAAGTARVGRGPPVVRRFLHAYAQLTAHPARLAAIIARARGENADSDAAGSGGLTRWSADPSLAAGLLDASPGRLLGDLNTMGFLFESLATRDLRVYAEAAGGRVFHYRESSGDLEVDLVVEHSDGSWAGFEVKLGGRLIDDAAAALLKMSTRVATAPSALAVITGTEYGYRRPDGVWVLPLGSLGP
jgi:hypothetical protein